VQRALERAGAKIRTKARHDQFFDILSDGVANEDLAAHIGRDKVKSLGFAVDDELDLPDDDLLDREDDLIIPALLPFRTKAEKWLRDAQFAALQDAADSIAEERALNAELLFDEMRDEYEPRMSIARTAALAALFAGVLGFSRKRLFDTAGATPTRGEFDDVRVPAGLVRDALRIAGGGGGPQGVSEDDSLPTGGIGTGTLVNEAIQGQGVDISGMTWDYGPATRNSFEPHLELDGLAFANWEDPALEVQPGDEWLDTPHYFPGDHGGCLCTVVSTYELAQEV
jgi:hypothetical protein